MTLSTCPPPSSRARARGEGELYTTAQRGGSVLQTREYERGEPPPAPPPPTNAPPPPNPGCLEYAEKNCSNLQEQVLHRVSLERRGVKEEVCRLQPSKELGPCKHLHVKQQELVFSFFVYTSPPPSPHSPFLVRLGGGSSGGSSPPSPHTHPLSPPPPPPAASPCPLLLLAPLPAVSLVERERGRESDTETDGTEKQSKGRREE